MSWRLLRVVVIGEHQFGSDLGLLLASSKMCQQVILASNRVV